MVAIHRKKQWDVQGLGFALSDLSRALSQRGELDEALTVAREATGVFAKQGFLWALLTMIASLALQRGHVTEAALALGRADAAEAWRDASPPPAEIQERGDLLRRLQKVLSASELERLLSEGTALTDEEAARIALAQ